MGARHRQRFAPRSARQGIPDSLVRKRYGRAYFPHNRVVSLMHNCHRQRGCRHTDHRSGQKDNRSRTTLNGQNKNYRLQNRRRHSSRHRRHRCRRLHKLPRWNAHSAGRHGGNKNPRHFWPPAAEKQWQLSHQCQRHRFRNLNRTNNS